MAERLNHSSDIPDLDTNLDEKPHLKVVAGRENATTLEDKARQLGTAAGKAVVTLRDATGALKDIGDETREVAAIGINNAKSKAREATRRIGTMAETVKSKTQELGQTAAFRASQFGQMAAAKAADIRSEVKLGYYRARFRANQVVREYPLQVVLAAGLWDSWPAWGYASGGPTMNNEKSLGAVLTDTHS